MHAVTCCMLGDSFVNTIARFARVFAYDDGRIIMHELKVACVLHAKRILPPFCILRTFSYQNYNFSFDI